MARVGISMSENTTGRESDSKGPIYISYEFYSCTIMGM